MLKQYLVHLKDLLFFRIIISILIITFLLFLLHLANKNYFNTLDEITELEKYIVAESIKVYTVLDSKKEILNSYSNYRDFFFKKNFCTDRKMILQKISDLNKKYSLIQPIEIVLEREISPKINSRISSFANNLDINLEYYYFSISFTVSDTNILLKLTKDLYNLFPAYTVILSMTFDENTMITQSNVTNLNKKYIFPSISSKIRILVREMKINWK